MNVNISIDTIVYDLGPLQQCFKLCAFGLSEEKSQMAFLEHFLNPPPLTNSEITSQNITLKNSNYILQGRLQISFDLYGITCLWLVCCLITSVTHMVCEILFCLIASVT